MPARRRHYSRSHQVHGNVHLLLAEQTAPNGQSLSVVQEVVLRPCRQAGGAPCARAEQVHPEPGHVPVPPLHVHSPWTQPPSAQVLPQEPQLPALVAKSMQTPPQFACVARLVQAPPQIVCPDGQRQTPAEQMPPLHGPHEPPQPSSPQALPAQFGIQPGGGGGVVPLLRFFFRLRLALTWSRPKMAGASPMANAPRIDVKARRVNPPLSCRVSVSK
jgi:hypothetical protein